MTTVYIPSTRRMVKIGRDWVRVDAVVAVEHAFGLTRVHFAGGSSIDVDAGADDVVSILATGSANPTTVVQ